MELDVIGWMEKVGILQSILINSNHLVEVFELQKMQVVWLHYGDYGAKTSPNPKEWKPKVWNFIHLS